MWSLDTSSTGSPKDQIALAREGARLPWTILIVSLVGLLLALYIGSQVLGVLVGILFPPGPPLPANLMLLSHQAIEHGVDEWVYESADSSPNAILDYYRGMGADCSTAREPLQDPDESSLVTKELFATCSGEMTFSIFAMRWDAAISAGANAVGSEVRVSREVFWTGAVPPRDFPLPESPDLGDN
jgi:hypothetical protein